MANLILSLVSEFTKRAADDFTRKTQRPEQIQEQFLRSLLQVQQNTALGQDYGLADIRTIEQFRQRVPILPYTGYEPYINRVAKGEPNVMTPDPVTYLNLTSGSTGKQKLIPVTWRSRQAIGRAKRASMGFAASAAQLGGKTLGRMLLTSSTQLTGYTEGGLPYGPVSVSDLRYTNPMFHRVFAHPFAALQLSDSLARHYICLLFALQEPFLRLIGANFPVLALRLCEYLERYGEELVFDIQRGAIADWLPLDPAFRATFQRKMRPNPQRAMHLQNILRADGRLTPAAVWPNLAFITTARGGTSNFYFERFPSYFGKTPIFGGVYASSEATFGVYHEFDQDETILAIESGFYEFIPVDQWDEEQPRTLLPGEVQVGEYYRILVTNYNGLYRYDIGDVVEVVGFYEQTPMIVFRHRRGGLLSSTSEKTTEFHVIQVMQTLQREFNLTLTNFCVTLSEGHFPAHYLVNIELAPGSTLTNPQQFIHQFDCHLKAIHVSYANKRGDQVPDPRLRILEPGSFAQVRQHLLQRGIPETQLKFPHISEDRGLLAGVRVQREVQMAGDEVGASR